MAVTEDAANVLEQFIHDVANLPAEVAHLYEEAQAKQDAINQCFQVINTRDGNIQKFIKQHGALNVNPKEEEYSNTIKKNFIKAQELQEEKLALVQKACVLMDRYVKRLDIKLRDLQNDGAMPIDHTMPSLLRDSPGNLVAPSSSANTGANTPLQPLSLNTTGGQPNVAQAAISQVRNAIAGAGGSASTIIGMQPHPLLNNQRVPNTPNVAAMAMNRTHREPSTSSTDRSKRPRPEGTLGTLPARPSNLGRQSSLGPGTPKAGTPGGSRAGSVGPRPSNKRPAGKRTLDTKITKKKSKHGLSSKINRRLKDQQRASPSTTGEDSVASGEDTEGENDQDQDMDSAADDDGADDTKYCYCQRVSYGDMVACDNAACKNQWFHWECVGLVAEPVGDWLCRDCAKLPKSKIKKDP